MLSSLSVKKCSVQFLFSFRVRSSVIDNYPIELLSAFLNLGVRNPVLDQIICLEFANEEELSRV